MPTKKPKRAKLPSCTVYAVRRKGTNLWLGPKDDDGISQWGSFAKCVKSNARPRSRFHDEEHVPCRVRVLPSARRNRARTR